MKVETTSKNYIKLAHTRNQLFDSLTFNNKILDTEDWLSINQKVMSVDNAIKTGLELMGTEKRAEFYEVIASKMEEAENFYRLVSSPELKDICREKHIPSEQSDALRWLHLGNATEHLKITLELAYPQEFPSDFPMLTHNLSQKTNSEPREESSLESPAPENDALAEKARDLVRESVEEKNCEMTQENSGMIPKNLDSTPKCQSDFSEEILETGYDITLINQNAIDEQVPT